MSKIAHNQLTKLYYSIGEVADMIEVNTSLIRFWEKEFPSIKPKKNKKGNRLYTPKEIKKIDQIYTLVKQKGYTLDGARKAMKSKHTIEQTDDNDNVAIEYSASNSHLIDRLEAIKAKLMKMKS